MATATLEATTDTPPVAGFWIRLLAHFIDFLIWGFATSLIGLLLVYAAPNVFGMGSAVLNWRSCNQLSSIPPSIPAVAGLSPNLAVHCTKSFLGLEYRNEVILAEVRREGHSTSTKSMTYAVGPDLQLSQAFDLDLVFWVMLLGYIVMTQGRYGATLGKWLLRLRVIGPDGRAPGWRAALVRNLVLSGPGLATLAVLLPLTLSGAFFVYLAWVVPVFILCGLASLVLGVQIWWTATHERPSFHDQVARTRVIRVPH